MTWAAAAYSMNFVESVEMAERNGRRAVMVDPVTLRETVEQRDQLLALADEVGADIPKFCAYFKIDNVAALPAAHYARAVASLESKRAKK